jgi:formate dehydrogenase subunit gamma
LVERVHGYSAAAHSSRQVSTAPLERTARLLRFDRVQRAAHWANATLFTILILTALPLYFSSIERVVGRHLLMEEIHVWAGVALPVPVLVSLVGPWGTRMRKDVRRFNRWTRQELRWLWSGGAYRGLEKDKFNPGQKLNAIFVGGSIVVMLGTGAIMKWFGLFPVGWRTGATFVHEVLAWMIVFVVVGHVFMAVTHRDALRSMVRGWVSVAWARRNAPRWAREELELMAEDDAPPPSTASAVPARHSNSTD